MNSQRMYFTPVMMGGESNPVPIDALILKYILCEFYLGLKSYLVLVFKNILNPCMIMFSQAII